MVDLKILGKAMGFMFLPTLGVLTMLLVGFFDPVAMWTFIKSDNGWAIFTRLVVFLIEVGLITGLYYHYKNEEFIHKSMEDKDSLLCEQRTEATWLRHLFDESRDGNKYFVFKTSKKNIVVVERREVS